ncbi:type II CAAX prenyl endopeptidase Rce1 family protein [Acidisarcina polymorpha]|uniref:CPBP family glutamic-type intramembrane protease n=1 Tax=Acidisarcina polymorpha TaxID=2211140 RepID=UPI000DEEE777
MFRPLPCTRWTTLPWLVLGAAAFFTVYHPLLAWLPVFCLGVANCLLFKRTRRLLPCILLHMTYNATVLMR